MAPPQTKFKKGEQVLVPAARLGRADQETFALVQAEVRGQKGRSVRIDDGAGGTVEVASRLVHRSTLGFLVLRIGDLDSETALLDPLAKSVLQFMRLLIRDEDVRSVELRTLTELDDHWKAYHGATSHVIIIGHGSKTSLKFMGEGSTTGKALAARLCDLAPDTSPKTFISLACLTGLSDFAKPFSENPICQDFIGPVGNVHGAVASQFCQSLMSEHLLDGYEIPWAYRRASKAVVGGRRFRRWHNGTRFTPPTA